MQQPRWVDAAAVRRIVSPDRARRLIRCAAFADGLDPASDPARMVAGVADGQLLVMPATKGRVAGVKVVSVAPGNPARGLERIQALYILLDADTLTPSVLIDGTAVTSLRTPAVSAVAMDALAPAEVGSAVIFGSGPQALGHAEALLAIRQTSSVTVVGRRGDPARATAQRISGLATTHRLSTRGITVDDPQVEAAVREAQVVVTATSAATPVLDDDWVADGACVVAIGSHEPHRRELGSGLLGRSLVVVEDIGTAHREAGDVILAAAQGALDWADVRTLADLVLGRVERAERPAQRLQERRHGLAGPSSSPSTSPARSGGGGDDGVDRAGAVVEGDDVLRSVGLGGPRPSGARGRRCRATHAPATTSFTGRDVTGGRVRWSGRSGAGSSTPRSVPCRCSSAAVLASA